MNPEIFVKKDKLAYSFTKVIAYNCLKRYNIQKDNQFLNINEGIVKTDIYPLYRGKFNRE